MFENDAWPIDIAVADYMRNSAVRLAADAPKEARSVDGYALEEKSREKQAELNIPGLYVDISADGEAVGEGIVWGLAREPLTITAPSGDKWSLQIRKRVYELPYTIKLRDFIKEDHPGTAMARRYMSDVTRIDGDLQEDVRIRMNHPLASGQYTFYQASFGPQEGDPPGTPPYTVLAVWKRPLLAGDWPLFACFTVALGLVIHFVMGLVRYFKREALHEARRAAKEQTPAEA